MVSNHYFRRQTQFHSAAHSRAGFTLIELMVVVGLILLIAVMTASAINTSISGDKVRGGARQVQSFLAGARDRAIYSKAPRGVRFLLDSTDKSYPSSRTVSSMVYIAPTDDWTQGTIQIEWYGGVVKAVRGFDNDTSGLALPTGWLNLYNQGLLKNGVRIKIPDNNTGEWYTVDTSLLATATTSDPPKLLLLTKLSISPTQTANQNDGDPAFQPGTGPTTYRLELPPGVMPNQEPVLLPKGCVIHLDRCTTAGNLENLAKHGDKLPSAWTKRPSTTIPPDPSGFDYSSMMDVMFSPRGVVIGPAAQAGIIHLYLGEQKDADLDRTYWTTTTPPTNSAPEYGFWTDPTAISPNYERGDKIVLTIFTRTGAVSTHPIHPTDRFKFAETGEVAGK